MTKRIVIAEGCVGGGITVDGKELWGETNVMSDEERKELTAYLLARLGEEVARSTVSIQTIIELFQYGEYETADSPCDQCGDTMSWTRYTI